VFAAWAQHGCPRGKRHGGSVGLVVASADLEGPVVSSAPRSCPLLVVQYRASFSKAVHVSHAVVAFVACAVFYRLSFGIRIGVVLLASQTNRDIRHSIPCLILTSKRKQRYLRIHSCLYIPGVALEHPNGGVAVHLGEAHELADGSLLLWCIYWRHLGSAALNLCAPRLQLAKPVGTGKRGWASGVGRVGQQEWRRCKMEQTVVERRQTVRRSLR
jgi:hypothetical protein